VASYTEEGQRTTTCPSADPNGLSKGFIFLGYFSFWKDIFNLLSPKKKISGSIKTGMDTF